MAKPAQIPRWAEAVDGTPATNVVEPTEGKKTTGYLSKADNGGVGDVPTSGETNWILRTILAWAKWVREGTALATGSTLVERDASGRSKMADPVDDDDVDTRGARNTAISVEAAARASAIAAEAAARVAAVGAESTARSDADAAEAATRAASVAEQSPIGVILPYGGDVAPAGFLLCDGQAPARLGTYAALFAVIGVKFGGGDGVSTFNVPDLRSEFLRGADLGRGIAGGHAIGTAQPDALKSHTHTTPGSMFGGGGGVSGVTGGSAAMVTGTGATGDVETRPRNVAVNFIIRAL